MPSSLSSPPSPAMAARHRRTDPGRTARGTGGVEAQAWSAISRAANCARIALSVTDSQGLPQPQAAGAAAFQLVTGRFLLDRLLERYVSEAPSGIHRAWRRLRSRHCRIRRQFTAALEYARALGGGVARPGVPSLFDPLGRPPKVDRFLAQRTEAAVR